MSIATELQNLNDNILDAYDAVQAKGGTVPANKNMDNLPAAIDSIAGITRTVKNGVYGFPTSPGYTFSLPSTATDLSAYALRYAFATSAWITSADFSSLTKITEWNALDHAFYQCTRFASFDFSSLTQVAGTDAFNSAFVHTAITTADFSSVTFLGGGLYQFRNAFQNCTSLTSVDFSSLRGASKGCFSGAFSGCTALTSVDFSSLTSVAGVDGPFTNAFKNCKALRTISFPALTSFGTTFTNQFSNMLSGVTGCTLHFPAAAQASVEALTGYPNFGGTNTTVLFDL